MDELASTTTEISNDLVEISNNMQSNLTLSDGDGSAVEHSFTDPDTIQYLLESAEDESKRAALEAEIRNALNQQTFIQFRQHAQEQYPKDIQKQDELIHQLQEQHYQQYLSDVYAPQLISQKEQFNQLRTIIEQNNGIYGELTLADLEVPPLIPASMWTRKDISEFKAEILKDYKECCIKICSLETATIRVPTSNKGKYVFWEFATDYYDLGFGVYFEWSINPPDKVTVHISESSDDEEDFDDEGREQESSGHEMSSSSEGTELGDIERRTVGKREDRPPTDELIPVYRRDCHEEVYCGSHRYPGQGFYVLKFDNSYSLWRSKWLYYRVYYTS